MASVTYLVKKIDVEMSGGSRWYMATAMQNDRATRYISARLLDEGEKYTIPEDVDVNVSIKKPDGKSILKRRCVPFLCEAQIEMQMITFDQRPVQFCLRPDFNRMHAVTDERHFQR